MPIRFCSLIARTAALSASRAIAALLALTIAPAILAPSVALAQGTLPTDNLVINPSANNGLTGWTNVQGQFSVRTSAPPTNVFWGGAAASSVGRQDIGVWSWAAQIDSGCVTASFEARLGGFEAQADNAYVVFEFLNASGAVITNSQLGPVTAAQRGNVTQLLQRSSAGIGLPPGTRTIRIGVYCQRSSGTNNDGYADDISVRLFEVPGCCDVPASVAPNTTLKQKSVFAVPGQELFLDPARVGSQADPTRLRFIHNGRVFYDGSATVPWNVPFYFIGTTTQATLRVTSQGLPRIYVPRIVDAEGQFTLELTSACGKVESLTWNVVLGCSQSTPLATTDPAITEGFNSQADVFGLSRSGDTAAILASGRQINGSGTGQQIGLFTLGQDSQWSLTSILQPYQGGFVPFGSGYAGALIRGSTLLAVSRVLIASEGREENRLLIHDVIGGVASAVPGQIIALGTTRIRALDFDGTNIVVIASDLFSSTARLTVFSRDVDGRFFPSFVQDRPTGTTETRWSVSVDAGRMLIVQGDSTLPLDRQAEVREQQGANWPVVATLDLPAESNAWQGVIRQNRIVIGGGRSVSLSVSLFEFRSGRWQRLHSIAIPDPGGSGLSNIALGGSSVIVSSGLRPVVISVRDGTMAIQGSVIGIPAVYGFALEGNDYLMHSVASFYWLDGTFGGSSASLRSGELRIPQNSDADRFLMSPIPPVLSPGSTLTLSAQPGLCNPTFSFWRFRGIVIDRSGPLPAPYQNMVATVQTDINAQGITTLDSVTITNLDPTATPDDFTYFRTLDCSVGIHYPQLSEGPDTANDTAPGPSIPLPGTFRSVVGTFSNLSPDHFRLVIPPHDGLKVHTIDFSEYFTASDPGAPAIRVELLGLSQANGVIDPNAAVAATTQIRTGITSAFEDPTVFYTHGPTSPVFVDVRVTPVAPELDGAAYTLTVFSSASQDFSLPTPLRAGQVTISAQSPAPTQDVDMWLYDEQFNPVPFAGNDDVAVLDDRAEFSISLPRGTYHLAVARGDVFNNQPAAPGDLQQFGPVFASPNLTAGSDHGSEAPIAQIALTFTTPDGNQTLDVQTSRHLAWVKVQVNPVPPCNPADIADTDAGPGSDGVIDNGDFSLCFIAFFSPVNSPMVWLADIANTDGDVPADGVVDNGDFTRFFVSFFEGCP
ncbi:MAG: hypothetical protein ACK5Q8_13870 [Phycisphaerales bacterium]